MRPGQHSVLNLQRHLLYYIAHIIIINVIMYCIAAPRVRLGNKTEEYELEPDVFNFVSVRLHCCYSCNHTSAFFSFLSGASRNLVLAKLKTSTIISIVMYTLPSHISTHSIHCYQYCTFRFDSSSICDN